MSGADLKEYQFFVRFNDVSTETMLENHGQTIHDDYMSEFGGMKALTVGVFKVLGAYSVQIQFRGPADSVTWLENAISTAAISEGGTAGFLALEVESDISEFFESSERLRS